MVKYTDREKAMYLMGIESAFIFLNNIRKDLGPAHTIGRIEEFTSEKEEGTYTQATAYVGALHSLSKDSPESLVHSFVESLPMIESMIPHYLKQIEGLEKEGKLK